MLRCIFLFIAAFVMAQPAVAQQAAVMQPDDNPLIDFAGHVELVQEVYAYRQDRLIPHATFQSMAIEDNVLLLDARSAQAFEEGHIEGAVNLPLPDFTAERLAEVIGDDTDRPILIYCNNNFINDRRPVVTKIITVALNVQTFTNLYAYGYRNVFELGEAVNFEDPEVQWVGTMSSNGTPFPFGAVFSGRASPVLKGE